VSGSLRRRSRLFAARRTVLALMFLWSAADAIDVDIRFDIPSLATALRRIDDRVPVTLVEPATATADDDRDQTSGTSGMPGPSPLVPESAFTLDSAPPSRTPPATTEVARAAPRRVPRVLLGRAPPA
jgi:hypothetical protein